MASYLRSDSYNMYIIAKHVFSYNGPKFSCSFLMIEVFVSLFCRFTTVVLDLCSILRSCTEMFSPI